MSSLPNTTNVFEPSIGEKRNNRSKGTIKFGQEIIGVDPRFEVRLKFPYRWAAFAFLLNVEDAANARSAISGRHVVSTNTLFSFRIPGCRVKKHSSHCFFFQVNRQTRSFVTFRPSRIGLHSLRD